MGDLAVGADRDDDGGFDRGAVWVLFLNTDGTVKSHQKISDTQGNFTGILDDSDEKEKKEKRKRGKGRKRGQECSVENIDAKRVSAPMWGA